MTFSTEQTMTTEPELVEWDSTRPLAELAHAWGFCDSDADTTEDAFLGRRRPDDPRNIPPHLREGLDRYARQRIPTGDFLRAVLSNDLQGVSMRASNKLAFDAVPAILLYLNNANHFTPKMWGSPEKVARHLREFHRVDRSGRVTIVVGVQDRVGGPLVYWLGADDQTIPDKDGKTPFERAVLATADTPSGRPAFMRHILDGQLEYLFAKHAVRHPSDSILAFEGILVGSSECRMTDGVVRRATPNDLQRCGLL